MCQLLKDFNIHPRSEFEVFFFDELELHVLGSLKQDQDKFTSWVENYSEVVWRKRKKLISTAIDVKLMMSLQQV